jgi:hypothetical protein
MLAQAIEQPFDRGEDKQSMAPAKRPPRRDPEMERRCKRHKQLRTTVRQCRAVVLNCLELPSKFPSRKQLQESNGSIVFSDVQSNVYCVQA